MPAAAVPITKRALFAGALAAPPLAALASTTSLATMWAEAERITKQIDDSSRSTPEHLITRLFVLEDAVLSGQIHTKADAFAKLKAAGVTFERGPRIDEKDGPAFAQAVAWLEAN